MGEVHMSTAEELLGFDPESLWPLPLEPDYAARLIMSAASCAAYQYLGFDMRCVREGDRFRLQADRKPSEKEAATAQYWAAGLFARALHERSRSQKSSIELLVGGRSYFTVRDEGGQAIIEPMDGVARTNFEIAELQDSIEVLFPRFIFAADELMQTGRLHLPVEIVDDKPNHNEMVIQMLDRVATALETPRKTTTIIGRDKNDLIAYVEQTETPEATL